jgi:exopolyphosphatase/guanosine-5'-triphosphate,3'-diphosphate pyrophosphatase
MTISDTIPQYDTNHYAVVDLGSNSFHLLIVHLHDNQLVEVNKVKRKVRLAAGLNEQLELSTEAITCGLDCLSLFAKHLATIPTSNIRIVATATLRIATNSNEFLHQANKILPLDITLLSGKEEAETIYKGAAYTCHNKLNKKRLVIDIGGASTELIIGQNETPNKAISLNLGCVSFRERFFINRQLTNQSFTTAIDAAITIIKPISADFIQLGWQSVAGSSGTIQALAEILSYRQQEIVITANFLQEIKQVLLKCKSIDNIVIEGLRPDRAAVLASGLCILIALFNCLQIKELELSTGALREGLLFEMLPTLSVL